MVFSYQLWKTAKEAVIEFCNSSNGNLVTTLNKDFFLTQRLYQVRKALESIPPKPLLKPEGKFDEQDLDDYLGYLDMIQYFVDKGILLPENADYNFGDFVKEAYKNRYIQPYIAHLPKDYKNPFSYFLKWGKRLSEK